MLLAANFPEDALVEKGFAAAAAVLGWKPVDITYNSSNPANIITSLQSAIAEHPAAIIMDGLLTPQFQSEIPAAAAAHIPLIAAASPDVPQAGVYTVGDTNAQAGYAGQILASAVLADASQAKATAHILQITVPEVATYLQPVDQGVGSVVQAQCTQCSRGLLDVPLANVFNGQYTQQVVSYIQSHPNINYIVSDSAELNNGLAAALHQAGLNNIKLYGYTAGSAQIDQLKSGQSGAWVVVGWQVLGWMLADEVARIEVHDPADLWNKEHIEYMVNSSNASAVDPNDPEFPAGYQQQFSKLWGK